jgi:hypothetical protein
VRDSIARAVLAAAVASLAAACAGESGSSLLQTVELGPARVLAGDDSLYDVRALRVAANGSILILTGGEPYAYRYVPGEPRLRPYPIRQGRGPRDLTNPWALVELIGTDSLAIWDIGNRKLVPVSLRGVVSEPVSFEPPAAGFVRSDIRDVAFGDPYQIATLGRSYVTAVFPGGVQHQSDFASGILVAFDPERTRVDTLLDFRAEFFHDADPAFLGTHLQATPLWAACHGRSIAVYDPVASTVARLDTTGHRSLVREVPLAGADVSSTVIEGFVRHGVLAELRGTRFDTATMERQVRRLAEGLHDQFPATLPRAVRLICDEQDHPWLQLFDPSTHPLGLGREWLVIHARPAEDQRIHFPEAFTLFLLQADRAYGVLTDSDGIQRLAIVALAGW